MGLHYNDDESDMYVNKTEICKFNIHDKITWLFYHGC